MIIYTDGSCQLNPGIGGWSFVAMRAVNTDKLIVASGGNKSTTSNRMELTAILNALQFCFADNYVDEIIIYTDSQYASRAVNEGWLETWIESNFKNIKNQDLWLQIYKFICKLNVKITWIKGHDGNIYNELADKLAKEATFFQGQPYEWPMPKI